MGSGEKVGEIRVVKRQARAEKRRRNTKKKAVDNDPDEEGEEIADIVVVQKRLGAEYGFRRFMVNDFPAACDGGEPKAQLPECRQCIRFVDRRFPCHHLKRWSL